jgi:hypothetical protein
MRFLSFVFCLGVLWPQYVRADARARLTPENLSATHEAAQALAAQVQPVELKTGYTDYRAILHAHSLLSHDSRSPLDEIIAAAKSVGVQVIMFSEHPAPHYDYYRDGHRGMHDGVLVIPGAETSGFLAYPTGSIQNEPAEGPQAYADLVRRDDGLVFLCHLEERMDWEIAGLTGSEIYNTHADLMEEKKLLSTLKSPLGMLALLPAMQKYPQEFFASIQDYPADYLRRYDELCATSRLTGVAANDSHHNQGIRAILQEDGKVLIEDRLGKKVVELDPEKVSLLRPLVKDRKPGDVVLELDIDPYERSFHHVSTHLLMPELSQQAVWDALKAGRAYVGFDWIADPTGFAFVAADGDTSYPLGSEVKLCPGLTLRAEAPLAGLFKLVRNGQVIKEDRVRRFEFAVTEPGIYRLEVWQNLAGELRPWILSNPIYIRP